MPDHTERKALVLITMLGTVLRILFVMHHADLGWQLHSDPSYYMTLAENMRHGVYSLFHPRDIPDTTHMPGYPWIIHLLGGNIPLVLSLQVAVSAAKVPIVHALALRLGMGRTGALAASLLMAVEPLDMLFTAQVLTECLFTTLLLLAIAAVMHPAGRWGALVAGVCLAGCAWLRPNGVVMLALLPLFAWAASCQRASRAWGTAVIGILLVTPWAIRYHALSGRWAMGDGGTVAMCYFHVPGVLQRAGDPRAPGHRASLRERAAATDWEDAAQVGAFYHGLRTDIRHALFAHPAAWAMEQAGKSARILVAPGRGYLTLFFPDSPAVRAMLLGLSISVSVMIILALCIWLAALRTSPRALLYLLLVAATLLLTGGASVAESRFKVPAMPMLLLAVAWAGERLRQRACAADVRP